jgi:hypothetical protein
MIMVRNTMAGVAGNYVHALGYELVVLLLTVNFVPTTRRL